MSDPFPEIKSKHSLVAKYVTEPIWEKLHRAKTMTSGFTLAKAIACAVEFNNQHCGIYAGDWDSYKVCMVYELKLEMIPPAPICSMFTVFIAIRCSPTCSTP